MAPRTSEPGCHREFGVKRNGPLQRTIESEVVAALAFYLNRESGLRGAAIQLDIDESGRVVIDRVAER